MSPSPDPIATRPLWRRKAEGFLALARLSNSPTVVTNVLAGAALAGVLVPNEAVAWMAGALVCFYTAGMYLNDLFDYEIDTRERPERPLPSGLISHGVALAITVGLFSVGSAVLAFVGWRAFVSGLVLVALIVGYDAWHKTNPISPFLMALTRAMVYVTAFLGIRPDVSPTLLIAASLLLLYLIGLTYIAKRETERTFTQVWPAVLLALPVPYFLLHLPAGGAWLLIVGYAAWTLHSIRFVYRGKIGGGITRLIAGISLLDALVLAMQGSTIGVILALAAFGLTLFLQRYIQGT